MIHALDGVAPRLGEGAWVAPSAAVIGDVALGAGATVWFGAVLRGDTNRITVGARTNVQDNTVVHVNPGAGFECVIGADVTIGHACIVHACTLHDRAFVGMGATVLDGAVIESDGMLAAGGLLAPGKRIPSGELWGGTPARKMRDLSPEDIARNRGTTASYVANGARYAAGMEAGVVDAGALTKA